jgi:hypothetical protein
MTLPASTAGQVSSPQVPPPIETSYPSPQPTPTLGPSPTLPPLPRPFDATSFPPVKSATGLTPNIAWGVETSGSLTIWTGVYSDNPEPNISEERAVAQWSDGLRLVDMAISPNHQSLAVLSAKPVAYGMEGDDITQLSVINLNDNSVQSVPDYDKRYNLYKDYFGRAADYIVGWIDDDNFAVQRTVAGAAAIASKDGTAFSRVPFPPQYTTAHQTALSPDRKTFFSSVIDGYWLYSIDGTNPVNIVAASDKRTLYSPTWSPNGKYMSFVAPKRSMKDGVRGVDMKSMGVWLLDLSSKAQLMVSEEDKWDVGAVWSPDSAKIAFLRANGPITDAQVNDELVWYNTPEKLGTNIYVVGVNNGTINSSPKQLTSLQDARNSSLQWSLEGNLVLSSTAGSSGGIRGLVSVSAQDGSARTLVHGAANETLVHPLIFR